MNPPRILVVGAESPLRDQAFQALESAGYQTVCGKGSPAGATATRVEPSREFAAVVIVLPAAPSWTLETVPAAPLILLQSDLLLGEAERWMLPRHPWPRVFLRQQDSGARMIAALQRLTRSDEPDR